MLGTFISDDFSGGVYDPFWNTDFTSDNSLLEYPPASGNYVAVRGSDGDDLLLPGGTLLSGVFDIDMEYMWSNAPSSGNGSVHLMLFDSGDNQICDLVWFDGNVEWHHGGVEYDADPLTASSYGAFSLRLRRVGSAVTAYWENGGGEVTMTDPLTFSGDFYIVCNGSTTNGINKISLQAASGLPYQVSPQPLLIEHEADIRLFPGINSSDIVVDGKDLVRDAGIETAVYVSLFTDRRADGSDRIPDNSIDKRGWWADNVIGSKLWLLRREKTIDDVIGRAEQYALAALQWLLDDGVVSEIDVSVGRVSMRTLELTVQVSQPGGDPVFYKYYYNWEEQIARRA